MAKNHTQIYCHLLEPASWPTLSLSLSLVGREEKRVPLRNHGRFTISVIHHHHHHHFYGLGPSCSVPSSWEARGPLHLNCRRLMFLRLIGLYVKLSFGNRLASIRRTCYFHCGLDFRILLCELKISSSSLIRVFLTWSFLL